MSNDIVWHELYDRLDTGVCPICSLIVTRTESFMNSILYEGVNDQSVRDLICNAEGLCNAHAYQLLAHGDPLGHAIIYSDVLNRIIEKMDITREPVKANREKCFFCQSVEHSESAYVKSFAEGLTDEAFRTRYSENGILCVHHYRTVLGKIKDASIQDFLKQTAIRKYRGLVNSLNEIKRKNDYRNSDEAWTMDEKNAWKKVVAIINGYQGMKEGLKRG